MDHQRLQDELCGPEAPLVRLCPEMVHVLRCTMVVGVRSVVQARGSVLGLAKHLSGAMGRPSLVSVRHVRQWHDCISGPDIYVGPGFTDVQGRPSAWANPYFFMHADPLEAVSEFKAYVKRRADRRYWLRPLFGKCLVCDCERDGACHTDVLATEIAELVEAENPPATVTDEMPEDAVEQWKALRGRLPDRDPDDSEGEAAGPGPRFTEDDVGRVNETIRGQLPQHESPVGAPAWPMAWILLVAMVRAATAPLFWEVFSGTAGLSTACAAGGWGIAPPHRYSP